MAATNVLSINLFLLSVYNFYQTSSTALTDKLCVSGASQNSLNGMYEYIYWDSTTNGGIFYNNAQNKYLYPYISSPTKYEYIIADTINTLSPNIACEISNPSLPYTFNSNDCAQGWQSDTNMRLVNCNDICITGSAHSGNLNGKYVWQYFQHTKKGSVYFCDNCSYYSSQGQLSWDSMYINPWIYTQGQYNGDYDWHISPDYQLNTVDHSSYCELGNVNVLGQDYIFNLDDCVIWKTYLGDDASGYTLTDDINMVVQRCIAKTTYSCTDKCYYHDETISSSVCSDDCDCQSTRICNIQNLCQGISQFYDAPSCVGPPTQSPTKLPTQLPSKTPTQYPSLFPSFNPTVTTYTPSAFPTYNPSLNPTNSPSNNPSNNPTDNPSKNPTYNPSISPTNNPSQSSNNPTNTPSKTSYNPSIIPTNNPSIIPSNYPTDNPLVGNDAEIISEDYVSTASGKSFIDVNNSNNTYQLKLILISVVTAFICCVAVICYVLYKKKRKQNEYKSSEKKIEMTISPETAKTVTVPQTSPRSENELIKQTGTDESAANNLFNIIASNIDSDNNNGDDGIYGNSYITPNGDDAISINGHKYKNSEGVAKEVKIIEGARVHTEGNKEVTSDVVEINVMQNNENIDENDDSNILLEKENHDHEQEILSNEHNKDSGYNFEQEEDIDDNLIHMNVLNNDPENEYNDNIGIGDNLDFIHGIMIYEDDVDKNMKTRQ
eukprot:483734_1